MPIIDIDNLNAFGVYRRGMNHENWWRRRYGRELHEFMQRLSASDQRRFFIKLCAADTKRQIVEEKVAEAQEKRRQKAKESQRRANFLTMDLAKRLKIIASFKPTISTTDQWKAIFNWIRGAEHHKAYNGLTDEAMEHGTAWKSGWTRK